ncbi:hypothetical protein Fmac_020917 [Flemingia macrophylla]|uniref:Uncharacterized protein n=1 Tax=Flemingia macrophylla TaxID=520843 RepID=A0ABD1LVE9_9FABA
MFESILLIIRRFNSSNSLWVWRPHSKTHCPSGSRSNRLGALAPDVAPHGQEMRVRLAPRAKSVTSMVATEQVWHLSAKATAPAGLLWNQLPGKKFQATKALKYKSLSVWHNSYLELESQNLTVLEFSAKLSYNLLESEEIQQTFLIYACMGQDALISDLVRYCISLGLLQGIDNVREARDRVHKLVARLKELSLLSESFSSICFTMQSLIRDAALPQEGKTLKSKEKGLSLSALCKANKHRNQLSIKLEHQSESGLRLKHLTVYKNTPEVDQVKVNQSQRRRRLIYKVSVGSLCV